LLNETISVILKRQSVRKYQEKQIKEEDLDLLLKAALSAPTGGNHQYTRFIAIQNKQVLEDINSIILREFSVKEVTEGNYQNKSIIKAKKNDYNFLHKAPSLIIVVSKKNHGNSMADSANAIQNIQIAATSLELGTCWINQLHWLTEAESLRTYLSQFGLEEDENIFGSVVIGYPMLPQRENSKIKDGRVIIVN
jgi:nitroreductase